MIIIPIFYYYSLGWDNKNLPRDRATGWRIKRVTKDFLSRPSRLALSIFAGVPHWAQNSSLRKEKKEKTLPQMHNNAYVCVNEQKVPLMRCLNIKNKEKIGRIKNDDIN